MNNVPPLSKAGADLRALHETVAPLAIPVTLPFEKVLPGPVTDYTIMTARGAWCGEYLLETRDLPETGFCFVQNKGRSAATMKPWLSLRHKRTGQGIAVLLAYSGNWVIEVQPRAGQTILRVDSSPSGLKPFAEFGGMPVPGALVSEFTGHWDGGSQPIARFIRSRLRRDLDPDWPPVQYNTWYAAHDRISEHELLDMAMVAAGLGCELFTVDAGWYGDGADWSREVGNWVVNRERFPNGLEAIAREARRLGMKFGLWIEIESACPTAPVLREHPEWVLKEGERPIAVGRTALDFGNPDVLAWAKAVIDRLMSAYALDYIKMDFNIDLPVDGENLKQETDPLYRHYRGLAALWMYMRTRYPKLIVENCASGSLRQDAMTAALTDTHWVSDNVDHAANLAMNFGVTYLFPPEICNHWTTMPGACGNAMDAETAFTVNMLGHMGLSGTICSWDSETRAIAAERIAFYKSIRARIGASDVFHLTPQADASAPSSMQALLYMDPESDRAILFAFHAGDPLREHIILLRGLKSGWYRVRMPDGYGPDRDVSGAELAGKGLSLRFPHEGASAVILIDPR